MALTTIPSELSSVSGIADSSDATAITIDSSENVTFAGHIRFADDKKTIFGTGDDLHIYHTGGHNYIDVSTTDQDLIFKGTDGVSDITALTLDMSEAGAAAFNSSITATAVYGKGDTDSGIKFLGSNEIAIDTMGQETIRFDAQGRVGIGTNDPVSPLHIYSGHNQPLLVESTDAYAGIEFKDNGSASLGPEISALSNDFIFYGGHASSRPQLMKLSADGTVRFGTVSLVSLLLNSSGSLGLSTTPNTGWSAASTSGRVPIQIGSGSISGRLNDNYTEFSNNAYASGTGNDPQWSGLNRYAKQQIEFDGAGDIRFKTAATVNQSTFDSSPNFTFSDRMIITNAGAVGIGTTLPDNLLHIKTTGSTPAIELEQDAGTSYKGLIKLAGNDLEIRGSSGVMEFYTGNNDGDSSTLRMSISAAGAIRNMGATMAPTSNTTESTFKVSFANGVANQKFKLILSNTWWGTFDVALTGTYSNQNMAGILAKRFGSGLNANSVFTNTSRILESLGVTSQNFHIGDIEWDSSLSKWVIVITHRVSTGNSLQVRVRTFAEPAGGGGHTDALSFTVGSVYTTDSTAYGEQKRIPCFHANLGNSTAPSANAIVFNLETFDSGSNYDTSNGRFTAPESGVYSFSMNLLIYPHTAGVLNPKFLLNGSQYGYMTQQGHANNSHTAVVRTSLISMSRGQYVQVLCGEGTSVNSGCNIHAGQSYFTGHLVTGGNP